MKINEEEEQEELRGELEEMGERKERTKGENSILKSL